MKELDKKFIPQPESPKFVYHGSTAGDIAEFEPRARYTPSGADVPPRVYATPNPAFAAAHSFPWGSDEGIDVIFDQEQTVLVVPAVHMGRLDQPVYIYTMSGEDFEPTREEVTGETFHASEHVVPHSVISFTSVREAIEHFGGKIEIV